MAYSPRDYHNNLADADSDVRVMQPQQPVAVGYSADSGIAARESEVELAAFERGRQQGEIEAVRRLEAEGHLGRKTFNDTTIINQGVGGVPVATANVVEIEHLTWLQRAAAIFGEVCSIGYIVIMAYWIAQDRGGVDDWSNTRGSGLVEQFNIHVVASFVGLFAASQAYLDYRLLPLTTRPMINKALYIGWQILALASFAIATAAAILAHPGSHMHSMHAWTAMLALFVYAAHAVYSIFKILFTFDSGVQSHRWNESVNVAEAPTRHNFHLSAEQRRDHNLQLPTLYKAAPTVFGRHRVPAEQYNADGSAAPVWSESPALTANNFFLVPRKKWAVASLIGLVASVLIGLGQMQVLLASGSGYWPQQGAGTGAGDDVGLDTLGTESILIGVIGLTTLAGVMSIAYAAMPPRTVVAKGNYGQLPLNEVQAGRDSISMGPTQPNTVMREEAVEVV